MSQQKNVSQYIKKWGNSASIALLDSRCQIFSHPTIEGVVGYLVEDDHAVVFGDPVCAPENMPKLANAFHEFSKEKDNHVIYLTASEEFSNWAMGNCCQSLLEVEEELVVDPANYPKKGSNGRLLHKKMNHATRANVVVKELDETDEVTKRHILDAEIQWLQGRKGPQMYMAHINFFDEACGKRCFYAEQNGRVVGFIYLSRLEAHDGWLLYLLATVPDAPGGTSEYLVLTVLDKLAEEDCHFFTFGVSAIEKMGEIVGLGTIYSWVARMGFKVAKKIFPLDNRRSFWKKFEPKSKRSFILFNQPNISFKEIRAIMKTVNASL